MRQISPRNGDRNRRRRDARRHRTLEKGFQKMRSLAYRFETGTASSRSLTYRESGVKRVSRLYVTRRDPSI